MLHNEINHCGQHTIFDNQDKHLSPNKKDLSDKLGRALEKNEEIHIAICNKISRLMGCSS